MADLITPATTLSGASPWLIGEFTVNSTPKLIRAFGLGPDDLVCVKFVRRVQPGSGDYLLAGCGVITPDGTVIAESEYLAHCGVSVCICQQQPWTVVLPPGDYVLELSGTNVEAHLVTVQVVDYESELPDLTQHCQACCVDKTWTPTGNRCCIGTFLYDEQVSNCGTLRHVSTPQNYRCGTVCGVTDTAGLFAVVVPPGATAHVTAALPGDTAMCCLMTLGDITTHYTAGGWGLANPEPAANTTPVVSEADILTPGNYTLETTPPSLPTSTE